MAVLDEYREEREAIKQAPFKKRVEYFFDYYKWHTIVTIIVVVSVIAFIVGLGQNRDTALQSVFINTAATNDNIELLTAEVTDYLEIDESIEEVIIDATYYLDYENQDTNHVTFIQKLITLVASQMIDTLAADEATYAQLAYLDMFMDLETCLTEDQLEQYADQLVYIDLAVMEEINDLADIGASTDDYPEYVIGSSEGMVEPVAVGIYIDDYSKLSYTFLFSDDEAIIGIVANTIHIDRAIAFIEYVLQEGE